MSNMRVVWGGDTENEANVAQLRHVLSSGNHLLLKTDFNGVVTAVPEQDNTEDAHVQIKPGSTVMAINGGIMVATPV